MKLKSVHSENFRAIEDLRLPLDPQMTVLHGENAYGKTSTLAAIAIGLGAGPLALPDVSGIGFQKKDQCDGQSTKVSLTATDDISWERTSRVNQSKGWFSNPDDRDEKPRHPLRELKQWLANNAPRTWDSPVAMPILAFYDTERAIPNLTKQRSIQKRVPSRYAALDDALSARTSFRELFEWFHSKENKELRERRNLDYRLKGLSGLSTAISSMIVRVTEPHVELRPLRFVVSEWINGESAAKRRLEQLSRGYQAVLAFAADLAWRTAQGNPRLPDFLESEAIGLMDAVELHLHPFWQQRIAGI